MCPWPEVLRSTWMILFKDLTCMTNPACPLRGFSYSGRYYHSCSSPWGATLAFEVGGRDESARRHKDAPCWLARRNKCRDDGTRACLYFQFAARLTAETQRNQLIPPASMSPVCRPARAQEVRESLSFQRRRPSLFWDANFENVNHGWRQILIRYLHATHAHTRTMMQINSRAHHLLSTCYKKGTAITSDQSAHIPWMSFCLLHTLCMISFIRSLHYHPQVEA